MTHNFLKKIAVYLLLAFTVLAPNISAAADSADDRTGHLKMWREKCKDPDPDVMLANIEQAIASKDIPIQQICIRSALESDSSDIKNLGLRAAIASTNQITFTVAMPSVLVTALERVNNNEKDLSRFSLAGLHANWKRLQGGLIFSIDGAKANIATSTWYAMNSCSKKEDAFKGNAVVSGTSVSWSGRTAVTLGGGTLNVTLAPGCELKGTLQLGNDAPIPITCKLL